MPRPRSSLYVTRPALPPLAEMLPLLEEIWQRRVLSNDGPFHQRLEIELARYLDVAHIELVSNATLGLLLALRQSAMCGKVITTPFSFAATSHAIAWAGLEPVFVDIDPETLNLDPAQLADAYSDDIAGLLPVHCFGRPCDTSALELFCRSHDLPLVYDSAHAFAVEDNHGSILRHGDFSVLSFHATKVFNTFEGGAIICRDEESKHAIGLLRNFGIRDEIHVDSVGLNAKLNEFQAALGCIQLSHVDTYIEARAQVDARYRELISDIPGIRLLAPAEAKRSNYYNFPILVDPEYPLNRNQLYQKFADAGIFTRRYFHPLISDLPMYRHLPSASPDNLPVARRISDTILCLPLYPDLSESDQMRVIAMLRHV